MGLGVALRIIVSAKVQFLVMTRACFILGDGNVPPQTILNVRKERYDKKHRFASEMNRSFYD